MKLLFKNDPFKSGWMYGRWEQPPQGEPSYYLRATLDGDIEDLREVILKELQRTTEGV